MPSRWRNFTCSGPIAHRVLHCRGTFWPQVLKRPSPHQKTHKMLKPTSNRKLGKPGNIRMIDNKHNAAEFGTFSVKNDYFWGCVALLANICAIWWGVPHWSFRVDYAGSFDVICLGSCFGATKTTPRNSMGIHFQQGNCKNGPRKRLWIHWVWVKHTTAQPPQGLKGEWAVRSWHIVSLIFHFVLPSPSDHRWEATMELWSVAPAMCEALLVTSLATNSSWI